MVSKGRPTTSAVVITHNEEGNIRGCLESLRWVDEIVLVDSESSDRTVSIAREFTERIFVRPWPGFPAQRNFGIAQATGEWILILDADERVTPEAQREITTWLASPESGEYAAAQVLRRNYFFGKWLRFGGAYPDYQWRLFKNGRVRYDEATLDTPVIDGLSKVLGAPFDHFTGEKFPERIRKINRETDYKAKERLATKKKKVYGSDLFIRPLATFVKIYFLKKGFRDGVEGCLYGLLSSLYTFVRYVKLWELTQG